MPAMSYGVGVTGINDTDLVRIRRVVRAACTDHTDSKSLSLDLMCYGFDPAYICNTNVVMNYQKVVWEG